MPRFQAKQHQGHIYHISFRKTPGSQQAPDKRDGDIYRIQDPGPALICCDPAGPFRHTLPTQTRQDGVHSVQLVHYYPFRRKECHDSEYLCVVIGRCGVLGLTLQERPPY